MPQPNHIALGGFLIAGVTTHSHAAWRHPRASKGFLTPEYYQDIGRTLERGKFDFLFLADNFAAPRRFGDGIEEGLRRGTQSAASLDPRIVLALLAGATEHLGLVATTSVTYHSPFDIARVYASLDHLSKGRVGWNVVTSFAEAEAQNHGFESHVEHDRRYDRAEEFLEVAYGLWDSWDEDALVQDKSGNVFADPAKVHTLDHEGEFFSARGPLPIPRSPQRRPVIFQAGSSSRGRDYAARWAEAIFIIDPTPEGRKAYYDDVKSRASNFGRNPDDIKILPAFTPFVGETASIGQEKQAFHNDLADPISGLITLSNHTDHDFSTHDLDEPVGQIEVPGIQGLAELVGRLSGEQGLTLRDIGKAYAEGVLLPQFAGTAADIADQIEASVDNGEADGWMVSPAFSPGAFDEFVDGVIPELQARGRFRTEYEGTTLRDNLGLGAPADLPRRLSEV